MRIGELSRRSGVPVPTIKFYVRERLLPAGELTSPNQADYGPDHERRLRLIRVLLEVGGLSLAAIAEVLEAADDPEQPVIRVLGRAAEGVPRSVRARPGRSWNRPGRMWPSCCGGAAGRSTRGPRPPSHWPEWSPHCAGSGTAGSST
ncbi:hypothetical protein Smic_12540 [Streptomyces microflavus]|uniref:HTH merR-type domain-containing protein n=1 Tax=Streptomyces microflavus TaxID=1919 RepID=A0A7J0CK67_STRMI|nr:hypothetical protein Smic_12540 [Streptomyces microflavus]